MSLRIHPLANEEMSEAFSWLIQKGRPEVAGRLFRLWLAGLEAIEEFPMRYPLAEDQPKLWEYRSYLLPSYGYRIIYEVRRNCLALQTREIRTFSESKPTILHQNEA